MNVPKVTNNFAVDNTGVLGQLTPEQKSNLLDALLKEPTNRDIDMSRPVIVPYSYRSFPKTVYHHQTGQVITVADEKQLKAAEKKGYQTKPAPDRDYSKVQNAIAAQKPVVAQTASQLEQEIEAEAL